MTSGTLGKPFIFKLQGYVKVMLSDSPFKEFYARLTTIIKNKEDILVCLISFTIE